MCIRDSNHDDAALAAAIVARLGIAAHELTRYSIAKRSYDARKRGALVLIYSIDADTPCEAALLQRLQGNPAALGGKVMPTPCLLYTSRLKACRRAFGRVMPRGRWTQPVYCLLYTSRCV